MTSLTTKLLEPFGIEVDLDLRHPLNAVQKEALAALRVNHHLLLFREQSLALDQQIEVMRCFGPILMSKDDGYGYVSNARPDGILGDTELEFHSDQDYSPLGAFYALSLQAIDVEDGKTSTVFCSAARAYHALPAELKKRLLAHEALDLQLRDLAGRNRLKETGTGILRCVHPLIRFLPISGRPALYVSRSGTDKIMNLQEEESEALLQTLFGYLYKPSNLLEHFWCRGDLVIWDNRALQHRRAAIPEGMRRTLQRVACAAEGTGIFDAFPEFMKRNNYYGAASEEQASVQSVGAG
jgi:taurine dioxygenase